MDDVKSLFAQLLAELTALRDDIDRRMPAVLSKRRAAAELSVSLSKLKGMIRQGTIRACVVGDSTGIPASEIRRIAGEMRAPVPRAARSSRRTRRTARVKSPADEAAQVRAALKGKKQP